MDLSSFLHHIQSQPAWLLLPSALGLLSIFNLTTSLLKHLYTFFFRPPKNLLLYGSWAFITGSTDGIGKGLAFQLAQKGLHLILLGRNPDKLKQVSTEIQARFKQTQIRTVVVDLAGDLTAGIERIREEIEGLEVGLLINCAGYGDRLRRFHEFDDEALRNLVKVNVEGLTKVTQVVLKGMLERNRGAIVNIGSGSSVVRPSLPLFAVYAATKAYVEQFSRSLHVEYKRKGIDVQCQIPLFVATKMVPFKRMSVFTPSPDAYARAAVRWIGYEPLCMPYWPHYIQWCVASLLPDTPTLAWRMSMSDREVLFIFHYDGDFQFDISRPVYSGGKQKMKYLSSDISYQCLANEAMESSNWDTAIQNLSMQYLHHNGRAFSMASIDNDNDVRLMFKASGNETNGIYLYVSNSPNNNESIMGEDRSRRTAVGFKSPKMPSSSSASLKREQVKLSTSAREQPTADLGDDTDMHYPSVRDDDDVCNEALDGHIDIGIMRADDIHLNRHSSNGQLHSQPIFKAESCRDEANPTNTDLRSNEIPKVDFDDKMEPNDMEMEFGNNSAREMWIGRVFPDRQTFRNTLAKFAIYGNFTLKHLKTNMTKVTARCKDQDCPWRIHASIVESGPQFKVRTYNPNHRCSKPLMGMAHQQATSALIKEFIMERVRQNVNLKPKEIMNDYQMEFGSIISYRKAYIAKEMALCMVRGSYEESFQLLPRYCKELELTNPGTVTNIDTTLDDRFRRFFWAFGPCIRSYTSSLRPVIAVDGSHLRGKYPGVLLVAVTHDANHKLLPIAFAFAEAERRDSWEWFLANLSISLGEPPNLTIVSDRQKGLIPALKNTIPHAMHCYCCRHISENIKAAFSDGAIVMKFWRAATSYRPCEYEAYMTDIRAVSQDAFNYIDAIGRQRWANAYIEGRRYDMLTSNAAECTNSLLKDTRVLPITKQVEEIRAKLMDFYQKRHLQSESITSRLTPYAEKVLSQEMDEARRLHVRVAGIVEFQVQSAEYVDVVDLERRSCTCRKWEILGIPCCHALAAMKMRNYDPYEFCEHWYFASTYRTTYSEVIHATRDSKQWEHTTELRVMPPMASKQPGRPKKNRIRTEDIGRVRRAVTCSNCKGRGHNRGSCRNPPVLS